MVLADEHGISNPRCFSRRLVGNTVGCKSDITPCHHHRIAHLTIVAERQEQMVATGFHAASPISDDTKAKEEKPNVPAAR